MRWVLDQPAVAGVIVGARHAQHLSSIAAAMTLELTDADHAAIAAIQAEAAGPRGEVSGLERIKGGVHASIMRYSLNRSN
jgi:diketogulonate reductase-like aldo/keto reductase